MQLGTLHRRIGCVLAATLLLAGCGRGGDGYREYGQEDKTAPRKKAPEHHHEEGPHGGHVVELGGHERHGEVLYDPKTGTVTVYLLGEDLKTALATDTEEITLSLMVDGKPTPLTLKPVPQEGDPEGRASRFQVVDATLSEHLKDEEDLEGRLVVTLDGKTYSGELEHDHHHEHDEGKHHDDEKDHKDHEK